MFSRAPDVPVDAANPFGHDRLGRQESAEILTQLISTAATPLVLAIDANWGQGKTTFLKMWGADLTGKGFRCVHFNAWEVDFLDDPLIPLVGEVRALVKDAKGGTSGDGEAVAIRKKLTKIGAQIVRRAVPVGVKIATQGVIDLDKAMEDDLSKLAEKLATDAIEHYERDKAMLEAFRTELAEYAKCIQPAEGTKPLIIFIDELDRCQPLFAVRLLERMKHLFAVPGVVFVLALDKSQLAASAQAVYGGAFEATGYLGRFFDLEYQFPKPPLDRYCRFLWDSMGFDGLVGSGRLHPDAVDVFRGVMALAAEGFRLSLRDVGQVMARCALALALGPSHGHPHSVMLPLLAVVKKADPGLYARMIQRKASVTEVLSRLTDVTGPTTYNRNRFAAGLASYVVAAFSRVNEYEAYARDANARSDTTQGVTDESAYYDHVACILAQAKPPGFFDQAVPAAVRRLEIAERFRPK